jgi:hypothetical protein
MGHRGTAIRFAVLGNRVQQGVRYVLPFPLSKNGLFRVYHLNISDFKIETGQAIAIPVLLDMDLYLFVAVVFGIGIAHKMNRSFTLYKRVE